MAPTLEETLAALRELRSAQCERDYLRGPFNLRLKGAARAAKLNSLENRLHAARAAADAILERSEG